MSDKNEIMNPDDGDNYFKKLGENIEDTVITKPNCKLCNSKLRAKAEALYDQKKNFKYIEKWLESNGDPINYKSICNHFREHVERQNTDLIVKEYVDHLSKYRINQTDDMERLEARRDMFEKSLLVLSAKNDTTSNLEELRKNAAALKSLNDSIVNIEKQIGDIKKENEPVIVVLKTLQVLINENLRQTDSQEVKKALVGLLDEFKERVDGLFLE